MRLVLHINNKFYSLYLRYAPGDSALTIKAGDDPDKVQFVVETPKSASLYEMKLMNIDQEHLGIPETDYTCVIKMPSGEFARVVSSARPLFLLAEC